MAESNLRQSEPVEATEWTTGPVKVDARQPVTAKTVGNGRAAQIDRLLKKLEKLVGHFDRESNEHKDMHRRLRTTVYVLTFGSAVAGSASLAFHSYSNWFAIAVTVFSGLIALMTSYEGMRRPGDLWITERNTHYALKDLKERFEFDLDGNPAIDPQPYWDEMEAILRSAKDRWLQYVRPAVPKESERQPGASHDTPQAG